jgi:exopolyphosphatase/guanosine-5'-triphosphate,3'-diphosphate pyrophosphatase
MRVATIDIGTNTVLLLVAEGGGGVPMRAVAERATITRLGQGVDRTRALAPDAVKRTTDCLAEYADVVRETGATRVAVVGTSAMRDARGAEVVKMAVHELFGVWARVISGQEEARLTFRGALSGLPESAGDAVVFDIGGGSTEVVVGRASPFALSLAESFDVGSVRLTERHGEDVAAIAQSAREAFAKLPPVAPDAVPVGVAGTMTTLAAVSLGLVPYDGARVHGHVMTVEALAQGVERLARLDVEARRNVPGMEPKRADVIVAGGHIALALLSRWGVSAVRVSDRGVRWGLAEELAG